MVALRVRSALIAFCALAVVGAAASTLSAADYYAGKRLTVLVNYAAGGPSDIEGRLLARHLQKYLDGTPTIIVQNIDGAGGMVGNNYLAEVAPKDGSVMGYFTGSAWNAANEPEKFHVDFKTYEFVAYQPGTSIYFARADIPPGLRSATDIAKAQGVVSGGLSVNNAKDLLLRLSLDMLDLPFKYVTGYQSNNTARLAFQRGEINYFSESPPGYRSVVDPQLVQKGEAVTLFYDPGYNGESFRVPKQVADLTIAPFHELYKQINNGRMPSGPLWDAYLSILTVNSNLQRLLVMPPHAPQAAIDTMRVALLKLNEDQAYADEAMKQIGYVPEYVAGPDTNTEVRRALTTKPETRAFIADYIKKAGR